MRRILSKLWFTTVIAWSQSSAGYRVTNRLCSSLLMRIVKKTLLFLLFSSEVCFVSRCQNNDSACLYNQATCSIKSTIRSEIASESSKLSRPYRVGFFISITFNIIQEQLFECSKLQATRRMPLIEQCDQVFTPAFLKRWLFNAFKFK